MLRLLSAPRMTHSTHKILFITANRVGDAVLSTGLLGWLLDRYPEARFTVACGPSAADLFRAVPRLDRLIVLRKQTWNRHWLKLWKTCLTTKWDLIIDLRNSAVSRLLFADKRYFHSRRNGQHKAAEMASVLDINPPPPLKIWIDDLAKTFATELVGIHTNIIAIAPSANWPPKQWPIDYFIQLVKRITNIDGILPHASVMILAEENDRKAITPLLQSVPDENRIEIIGRDLLTAAACMKHCQLFIGNDSGLMHLSAAAGLSTLGLFGPGYEDVYGPWGRNCTYVRTPESRETLLSRLPDRAARSPNLMQGLDVETVYEAVTRLIQKSQPSTGGHFSNNIVDKVSK